MRTFEVADDGESAPLTAHAVPAIEDGSVVPSEVVTPQPGDPAYLYDWVVYDTAEYDGETWIVRRLGSGAGLRVERIAGPITSASSPHGLGLEFIYYDDAGAALAFQTDGSLSATDRALVRQVDVAVTIRSRRPVGPAHQIKTDTVTVYLRNR